MAGDVFILADVAVDVHDYKDETLRQLKAIIEGEIRRREKLCQNTK